MYRVCVMIGQRRPGVLRTALVVAMGLGLIVGLPMTTSGAGFSISLARQLPGHAFDAPTQVTHAGDATNRLFIAER